MSSRMGMRGSVGEAVFNKDTLLPQIPSPHRVILSVVEGSRCTSVSVCLVRHEAG
jgi:hypothetical protein